MYVAADWQVDSWHYAVRSSSSPIQLPRIRPATVDGIEITDSPLLPPRQNGEPEAAQHDDSSRTFIVGTRIVDATSAVPITMMVGYAIWMLTEESIVTHRLMSLAMARCIDPLGIRNVFAEPTDPLLRESGLDRQPVKCSHSTNRSRRDR